MNRLMLVYLSYTGISLFYWWFMENGYLRLSRTLLYHRYFQDSEKLRFWIWCLLKASHTKHKVIVGNDTIELEVGQFVTGRKKACEELKVSEQAFRTLLNFFEKKEQKLTNKSTSKYTLITINEYDIYNSENYKTNQQINQHLTSVQPAPNQRLTTYNKDNNGNNEKNTVLQRKFIPPTIEDIKEYIKENDYSVDPNTFLKYFTESNWIDSNGKKVKNWKQKIITWEGRNITKKPIQQKNEFGY